MAASTSASDLSFDFAFDTDSEEEFGGFDSFDVNIAEKLEQDHRQAFDRESDNDFLISPTWLYLIAKAVTLTVVRTMKQRVNVTGRII